ncbi:opacity protein [Sandarakinorhabdus sp.]|uniref:outer membrane protein n=1 Tax=Sandarakinorhabdus sp. TaxID=1916663 RepID=UPI00286E2EF4|nr:opacity protein [Sandarakinorhabdus sp.]
MTTPFAANAAAILLALSLAVPALAQDSAGTPDTASARAPDGSRPFGFEPYFGILGGYDSFDRNKPGAINAAGQRLAGAQIEGVIGANIPLGPLFVGVEGFGAKGFGPINWEYGARARAGFRIGDSGLVYGSFGHTWIDMRNNSMFQNRKDWVYGLGVEVGPKDIGLGGVTGRAGPRLRLLVESYDLQSIRPMAGIIFHF